MAIAGQQVQRAMTREGGRGKRMRKWGLLKLVRKEQRNDRREEAKSSDNKGSERRIVK